MKQYSTLVFVILTIVFSAVVNPSEVAAQTKTIKKAGKKKQTPEKAAETDDYSKPDSTKKTKSTSEDVQIIQTDSDYERRDKSKSLSENYRISRYNILKVNTLDYFIGSYPLVYERVINKRLSVEATVGLTYGNLFSQFWASNATSTDELAQIVERIFSNAPKIGYMYGVSARYYFGKYNSPEGIYVMGGIQKRSYQYLTSSISVANYSTVSVDCLDVVRAAIGYQLEHRAHWMSEIYIGGALRHTTYNGAYYDAGVLKNSKDLGYKFGVLIGARTGISF
ncbi:MAG: hypothetical protein RLZZ628_3433 [Bacteroidota bacterium]|jgi:Ni/Co efflux regulator RcnB